MRKIMSKEVTKTVVKAAKMVVVDGLPVAEPIQDEVLLGNVSLESAQRILTKKHGKGVTVFDVAADTNVYEMEVERFIELADLKEEDEQLAAELA